MSRKTWIILVGAIVIVGCVLYVSNSGIARPFFEKFGPPPEELITCTAEARLCGDGTAVGRIAPLCQFDICPGESTSTQSQAEEKEAVVSGIMNQKLIALGITLEPTSIKEDSRCAIDVVCIQAGTVRLQARVTTDGLTKVEEFTLQKPMTTDYGTITLSEVSPQRIAGAVIQPQEYLFTFTIQKRP